MIILTFLGALFIASLIGMGVYNLITKQKIPDLGTLVPDTNGPPLPKTENIFILPVQINGRKICTVKIPEYISDDIEDVKTRVFALKEVEEETKDKDITNVVYVPKRIVNIVIRDRKI